MTTERKIVSAPAAHTVTYTPTEGGILVGHTRCSAPGVFVPVRPDTRHVLAIDTFQAILSHKCPPGEGDSGIEDDPESWIEP